MQNDQQVDASIHPENVIGLDRKTQPCRTSTTKPTAYTVIRDGHDTLRGHTPTPPQRQTPNALLEAVGDIDHDVRTIVSEINDATRDMARHVNTVSWMRTTQHFSDEHGEQIAGAAKTLMDAVLDVMSAANSSDAAL